MTDHLSSEQSRPLRFLTMQQVGEELNTKHNTVRALIGSGDLPAIQIGGRGQWRIERSKLEDYIAGAYAKARADIVRGDVMTDVDRDPESDTGADAEVSGGEE